MDDAPQISDVTGMTGAQIKQALDAGQLCDLLSGTAGQATVAGDQEARADARYDADWLRQASPTQVSRALRAGKLNNLLRGES